MAGEASPTPAVPMSFEIAAQRLRLRLVPGRHIAQKPESYVGRELAGDLHAVLAIDNPEHVVFVNQREPGEWGRTVDELHAIAERNTRAEPALDAHPIEVPDGPTLTALLGESYFASTHIMFLDRYLPPGERGHLVAVPDRHALIALALDDPKWMAGLAAMVNIAHRRYHESPGAITDQLYWRRPDATLVKIPCGVRDDGTAWVAPPDAFNTMAAS